MTASIKKTVLIIALTTGLGFSAMASGEVQLNDESKSMITQILTEQGYEVGKIKIEDGLYEAYARKDGQKYEIFMDAEYNVVRTEMDD